MNQSLGEVSFLRRVIVLAAVLAGGGAAIWTFRPDRFEDAYITSGSMANSFWGPSFLVKCGDCGFSFRCDAEKKEFVPSDRRAVCPNCANGNNPLTNANRDRFGQQVKYDPGCWNRGALRRWTTVAFQSAGRASVAGIKRIVGLPNDWIEIRQGDIFVNGRRLQKSLKTQRQLAVLVHDATFPSRRRPQSNPWRSVSAGSGWTQSATGFNFHPTATSCGDAINWLEYRNHPTEPLARGVLRPDEAPINDNSGYNQGIARDLNDVRDVMLSCWVRLSGLGDFVLVADDGVQPIEIVISADDDMLCLRIRGKQRRETRIPSLICQPRKLELSLFDRQFLLAIDGRALIRFPLSPRAHRAPGSRPFRVGARNLCAWIGQLRIYRDTYYLNDRGLALPWRAERQIGADQYFLLGDNPPISLDSRHWSPPAVARKLLLGKVLHASTKTGLGRFR